MFSPLSKFNELTYRLMTENSGEIDHIIPDREVSSALFDSQAFVVDLPIFLNHLLHGAIYGLCLRACAPHLTTN